MVVTMLGNDFCYEELGRLGPSSFSLRTPTTGGNEVPADSAGSSGGTTTPPASTRTERVNNFLNVLGAVATGGVNVLDAISRFQGQYPDASAAEVESLRRELEMKRMMPWIIGGGVAVVALFVVMGTRRRR
jgi:hypothetical protein